MNEKYCKKCDQNLSVSNFGVNKKMKDGLSFYCSQCLRKNNVLSYRNKHIIKTKDKLPEGMVFQDIANKKKNKDQIKIFTKRWSKSRKRYEIFALGEKFKIYDFSKSSFDAELKITSLNNSERNVFN